jgi:hypothetical protein
MPRTRTTLVIAGIGSLLSQGFGAAEMSTPGASQLSETEAFRWNWRNGHELNANQSLRKGKLTEKRRKAIARAISDQIRSMMADLEIVSETDLLKAALDTKIKMIDLNGDGVPEILAQGMVNCGATGNCPFWALRRAKFGDELLPQGEAQTFTIQKSITKGFHDIVLSRHGSYSSGDLTHYQYHEGASQGLARPSGHLGIGALTSMRVCGVTSIASRVASFNTRETSSFDPATIVNVRS